MVPMVAVAVATVAVAVAVPPVLMVLEQTVVPGQVMAVAVAVEVVAGLPVQTQAETMEAQEEITLLVVVAGLPVSQAHQAVAVAAVHLVWRVMRAVQEVLA